MNLPLGEELDRAFALEVAGYALWAESAPHLFTRPDDNKHLKRTRYNTSRAHIYETDSVSFWPSQNVDLALMFVHQTLERSG